MCWMNQSTSEALASWSVERAIKSDQSLDESSTKYVPPVFFHLLFSLSVAFKQHQPLNEREYRSCRPIALPYRN